MLKHIVTDALEHALSDEYHHSAVNKGCDHPYCEDAAQNCHCLVQFRIIVGLSVRSVDNIIIQQIFQHRDTEMLATALRKMQTNTSISRSL